jgi:hypothetical protein
VVVDTGVEVTGVPWTGDAGALMPPAGVAGVVVLWPITNMIAAASAIADKVRIPAS